uniref:Uncharacterized protein n=1 Tax=Cacopsylla melanoneura TaxID=428564 RepID=A0A8D8V8F1_9HEMI
MRLADALLSIARCLGNFNLFRTCISDTICCHLSTIHAGGSSSQSIFKVHRFLMSSFSVIITGLIKPRTSNILAIVLRMFLFVHLSSLTLTVNEKQSSCGFHCIPNTFK